MNRRWLIYIFLLFSFLRSGSLLAAPDSLRFGALKSKLDINQDKRGFFPNEKRIDIIRQATAGMEGVSIIQYDNLTIDTCRQMGIHHIVRGVRNMIDFETERSIADANRRLAPDIETIIIPTAQEFAHISSTAVRDILRHGGDTSLFVPEGVEL